MDSSHSLVSIAIDSLLRHQANRLAGTPLLLRSQRAAHDLISPSAIEEFIRRYMSLLWRIFSDKYNRNLFFETHNFLVPEPRFPCCGDVTSNPAALTLLGNPTPRSNTWHQLRTLPVELTVKFIEKVLLWTYSSDERVSMLLLSLILRDTNFTDLDFAARVSGVRTHRIPAVNPSSWQLLGFMLPSSIVRINLNHLNVEDSFLTALAHSAAAKSVRKLKLRQSMITNDGLRLLGALKSLETLDVSMIPFSAGACTAISEACPQLQVLYIGKIDQCAERFVCLETKIRGQNFFRLLTSCSCS